MPVRIRVWIWGNKGFKALNTSSDISPSLMRQPSDCLTHISHLKLHLVVGSIISFPGNMLTFYLYCGFYRQYTQIFMTNSLIQIKSALKIIARAGIFVYG